MKKQTQMLVGIGAIAVIGYLIWKNQKPKQTTSFLGKKNKGVKLKGGVKGGGVKGGGVKGGGMSGGYGVYGGVGGSSTNSGSGGYSSGDVKSSPYDTSGVGVYGNKLTRRTR